MAATSKGVAAVRRKQMLLLGAGFVGVLVIAALAAWMTSGPAPQSRADKAAGTPVTTTIGAPGGKPNPEAEWRVSAGADMATLKTEVEKLRSTLSEKQKADEERDKKEKEKAAEKPVTMPPSSALPRAGSPSGPLQQPGQNGPLPRNAADLGNPDQMSASVVRRLVRADFTTQMESEPSRALKEAASQTKEFLPVSFMRAINLAGVYAPTGGQAQHNPTPIIYRIVDPAQLPNRFKGDYRECFVTGNATGNLSANRADIVLDRLSCVKPSGESMETTVTGYVSGSDGIAGMPGKLISRQDSALTMGLLASIASGIGTAFSNQGVTTATSALGTTQSVTPGDSFKVGMGQGVSRATDKLANYYMKLADTMFPTIEVSAGQQVDVVITVGANLGGTTASANRQTTAK